MQALLLLSLGRLARGVVPLATGRERDRVYELGVIRPESEDFRREIEPIRVAGAELLPTGEHPDDGRSERGCDGLAELVGEIDSRAGR